MNVRLSLSTIAMHPSYIVQFSDLPERLHVAYNTCGMWGGRCGGMWGDVGLMVRTTSTFGPSSLCSVNQACQSSEPSLSHKPTGQQSGRNPFRAARTRRLQCVTLRRLPLQALQAAAAHGMLPAPA